MRMSAELITVGRIGRPQGLRGEVRVEVRTDEPELRFTPGSILHTDAGSTLTVDTSRAHGPGWVIRFEGIADRTAAESLRGIMLMAPLMGGDPGEADSFYDYQLVGLRVRHADGSELGSVTEVVHLPGHDLLAVDHDGEEVLVPFVKEIAVTVDLEAGTVVVDPPAGLFDAAEADEP